MSIILNMDGFSEMYYSDQQKDILENGVAKGVDVSDMKNPGINTSLLKTFIDLRAAGYDIEILEDHGIGLLSITYLDCIRELVRNGIDIYQLIYNDMFIPYDNRQILTITDGLLCGFNLKLFGNINMSWYQMRDTIESLKERNLIDFESPKYKKKSKFQKFIRKISSIASMF